MLEDIVKELVMITEFWAEIPWTGFYIDMDRNFVFLGADTIAEVKLLISPLLR
jgi:hypothetical protein